MNGGGVCGLHEGGFRNTEGQIVVLSEGSALWTDKAALLKEMELSHPGLVPVAAPTDRAGEWFSWRDNDGTERFVVIVEAWGL